VESAGAIDRWGKGRGVVATLLALLLATEWWLVWFLPRAVMAQDVATALSADDDDDFDDVPLSPQPARLASKDVQPPPVMVRTVQAEAPRPPPPAAPPRDAGPTGAWSAAERASLPRDLGKMGPSLSLGLDAARRDDMEFCFRDAAADRSGGSDEAPRVKALSGRRSVVLMLYLEAREGAVDVIDARVEKAGNMPSSIVECCQQVLRGLEVGVFFAKPGRYKYLYEIEE
jgi:hypothetical protein